MQFDGGDSRAMTSDAVLAIVLTHNAPEALDRCLAGIDTQTRRPDRVLVIDNATQEPVRASLREVPIDVVRSEVNTGPAGGHALGLARFLESNAAMAWVMDDDCIPQPNCLAHLVTRHESLDADAPVFPMWTDATTGEGAFVPAWCGFLISRSLVVLLGLPRADFVWWAEDTEYLQWRVYRAGITPAYESSALVEHRRVRTTPTKPAWKIYYEVRNTIFFRLYLQRKPFTRFKRMSRSLSKLLAQILVREDRKAVKFVAYWRGVFDGFTGRLGLRIPPGGAQ
jgi:GT2 family glycosyltransferase